MLNHYEVLELNHTATDEEITKQYRVLSRKWHPDRCKGDKETAREKFILINNAYNVLKDPIERAKYDKEINLLESSEMIDARETQETLLIAKIRNYINSKSSVGRRLISGSRISAGEWLTQLLQHETVFTETVYHKHMRGINASERLKLWWPMVQDILQIKIDHDKLRKSEIIEYLAPIIENLLPYLTEDVGGKLQTLNESWSVKSLEGILCMLTKQLQEVLGVSQLIIQNKSRITQVITLPAIPVNYASEKDVVILLQYLSKINNYYDLLKRYYCRTTPYSRDEAFTNSLNAIVNDKLCTDQLQDLITRIEVFRRTYIANQTAEIADTYQYIVRKEIIIPNDLNQLDDVISDARVEIEQVTHRKREQLRQQNGLFRGDELLLLASLDFYELQALANKCEYRQFTRALHAMYQEYEDVHNIIDGIEETITFSSDMQHVQPSLSVAIIFYFKSLAVKDQILNKLRELEAFKVNDQDQSFELFSRAKRMELQNIWIRVRQTQDIEPEAHLHKILNQLNALQRDLETTMPFLKGVIHDFKRHKFFGMYTQYKGKKIETNLSTISFEDRKKHSFVLMDRLGDGPTKNVVQALNVHRWWTRDKNKKADSLIDFETHINYTFNVKLDN